MKPFPSVLRFALLCGVSLPLWFRPLAQTFWLASGDEKYTDILLILPLAAVLIVQGFREPKFELQSWTPAAGLLAFALLLWGTVRWTNLFGGSDIGLTFSMASLVLWWIASFVLCFGIPAWRSMRFPLLFLFWVVPIPALAMDRIVAALAQGSTLSAEGLFAIFGPIARHGNTLYLPGLELDVAAECSSIRSSLMLLVSTILLAHLFLRAPWRKWLLIVLASLLSVAKNGLRIFVIGMLSTRVDSSFLHGRLHREGGIVFFSIALLGVMLLLWILRRGEARAGSSPISGAKGRTEKETFAETPRALARGEREV